MAWRPEHMQTARQTFELIHSKSSEALQTMRRAGIQATEDQLVESFETTKFKCDEKIRILQSTHDFQRSALERKLVRVPPFRPSKRAVDLTLEERACVKGKDLEAAAVVRAKRDEVVAQENADYIVFVEQYRTNQRALLAAKQKEEMTSALQRNLEILAQARRDVNAEYNRTLKSFDIRKDILSHKQTLEMSQRPLVAPAPHQVAALLAATSAGQKTQKAAKQGGDYSLARIHDFNNNELTSQQFTQLSRNAFKTPDAQERQQALLKTLGEANFEAAEFDLVANFRESTMVEGSQSSRSNASSQWRVASSGWHTRREPISGESEPASSGEKNSHASHPNLPAPQSLPTSFPVKMATRPQPLNISRSRPLSALSLVSRAKEGKLNSTSMLGELTARSAMNTGRAGTSLMQTQAAAKEKSGDVIARPSSSLRGTMNTPTSNRLLAF